MIEELIKLFHEETKKDPRSNVKLAEVMIKMIEVLQKHAPGGDGQKRFWKMVEEIRQSAEPKKLSGKSIRSKSGTNKKKKK
jgi:hypothetical protein